MILINKIFIKKDNLVIRSATIEDVKILNDWWNDGRVMAHAGFPLGLGQSLEETTRQILENETNISQRCIIMIDEKKIGEMNYRIKEEVAAIGIKICEFQYQNQGYGTKLLKMLIDFLFTDRTLNKDKKIKKIVLDTNLNNVRAQKVYEKIGFLKIKTNINSWKDQLGNWQSSVDYEMTRETYNLNK
ncbi:MAG: GNAT family protein [Bacilli bacterium]|nr:GNAT family protein [Bacilli bacterium]